LSISPITGQKCPEGSRKLRFPDYVTMAQNGGKVVNQFHYRPEVPRGFQVIKVPRLRDNNPEW
jgi:hypothetical protein